MLVYFRKRWSEGIKTPKSRKPRDIGTIKKSMRNVQSRGKKQIFEPVIGMCLIRGQRPAGSLTFYSWVVGFGICFGLSSRNKAIKY